MKTSKKFMLLATLFCSCLSAFAETPQQVQAWYTDAVNKANANMADAERAYAANPTSPSAITNIQRQRNKHVQLLQQLNNQYQQRMQRAQNPTVAQPAMPTVTNDNTTQSSTVCSHKSEIKRELDELEERKRRNEALPLQASLRLSHLRRQLEAPCSQCENLKPTNGFDKQVEQICKAKLEKLEQAVAILSRITDFNSAAYAVGNELIYKQNQGFSFMPSNTLDLIIERIEADDETIDKLRKTYGKTFDEAYARSPYAKEIQIKTDQLNAELTRIINFNYFNNAGLSGAIDRIFFNPIFKRPKI